jgi:hypothetical protein
MLKKTAEVAKGGHVDVACSIHAYGQRENKIISVADDFAIKKL